MEDASGSTGAGRGPNPPGEFDGFRVVRPLGRGGMGTVYLGHDEALDRPVALKFIASRSPDRKARDRFLIEARAIARLHHPNVVGIYRIGEVNGNPYLAYEFVAGTALHQVEGPVPWRQALSILSSAARGLAAVHRCGVLHRDIKPANMILRDSGEVKLLDFGVAKIVADDDGAVESTAPAEIGRANAGPGTGSSPTTEGKLPGTPGYMAPELWRGEPAGVKSDLYALGLVVYELLTGALPWGDEGRPATLVEALAREVPLVHSVRRDVPASLAAVVDRLTRRNPRERYESADPLVVALEGIQAVYRPFTVHEEGREADDDAALVADSFSRVAPSADPFAQSFYQRLFAEHGELRPLFPSDLTEQRKKLVSALNLVVHNLRTPEVILSSLDDLGSRHADYGVRVDHFTAVGEALLATLEDYEGPAWTPTLGRAWTHAYQRLADTMLKGLERRLAVGSSPAVDRPHAWSPPTAVPRTQYARTGDAAIAYQVVGSGPMSLVVAPGWVSHVEQSWLEPSYARFLGRLASRTRLVLVDKRGTGLSERAVAAFSLEDRAGDLVAVMDAVGIDRGALLGWSDSAPACALLGATRPERVRALVLYGATPRGLATEDFPEGLDPTLLDRLCEAIQRDWGEPLFLADEAPSRAHESPFRAWWGAFLRAGASPAGAVELLRTSASFDVRATLPHVTAPTLIVHRRGDRKVPLAGGRALAQDIPSARLIELDGDDHLPFASDGDRVVDEILGFLLDLPTENGKTGSVSRLTAVLVVSPGRGDPVRGCYREIARYGGVPIEVSEVLAAIFDGVGVALRCALACIEEARARGGRLGAGIDFTAIPLDAADASDWVGSAAELAGRHDDHPLITAPARDLLAGQPYEVEPRGVVRDGGGDEIGVFAARPANR